MKWTRVGPNEYAATVPGGFVLQTLIGEQPIGAVSTVFIECARHYAKQWIDENDVSSGELEPSVLFTLPSGAKCPSCGFQEFYRSKMHTKTGIYCGSCSRWYKWETS